MSERETIDQRAERILQAWKDSGRGELTLIAIRALREAYEDAEEKSAEYKRQFDVANKPPRQLGLVSIATAQFNAAKWVAEAIRGRARDE